MTTAGDLFDSDSTDVQALFARPKGEPRNVGIFMGAGVSCAAPCGRPPWGQYLESVIKRCQELGRIKKGDVTRLERRARQGEMLAVAEECRKLGHQAFLGPRAGKITWVKENNADGSSKNYPRYPSPRVPQELARQHLSHLWLFT